MRKFIFCFSIVLFLFKGDTNAQCIAAFSWDDTNPTIQFYDESTVAPGDVIVSWFWDFDDENFTSTLQNPVHTFTEIDKFDVELTITTANGCTSEIEIRIEICDFNINVTVGECNGNNEIPITVNVIDVYDNADEIDIVIDGQVLPGGPYEIEGGSPVNVTVFVFGDGLPHILTIQSSDIETCNESFTFTAEDCTSDCFLGSMQVGISGGTTHTVQVGDDFFDPINTTIVVGDLVTFDWVGSGHSTTSDITMGIDSWNSGVIGLGSTYDVSITNPGIHPFYCIPHGGPGGVGMSGTIIANCPLTGAFDLSINFNTTIANPAGYEVLIDGQVQAGSPYAYNGIGVQSVTASILGDGINHVIQIRDIADPTCIAERNFLAPDCGAAPSCSLTVAAEENGACDTNNRVPVQLTINPINGSATGYNVSVDGINVTGGPFAYNASGVTISNIDVLGDGQSHNILVTDAADLNCLGTTSLVTTNCTEPCLISNFEISTGMPTTHIVNVEDFVFDPAHITITSGDIVQWNWTGVIAHTSTSDAISGADSWESGLLDNGATYQSPILSDGVHPYYCIPHGGPGGVGMSGSITVLPSCTNGEVSATLTFNASGGSFNGYNVLIDGILTTNSPQAYDPSGWNMVVVSITGDGQSHTIEIQDADNSTCNATVGIVTPDCNATNCNLNISAIQNGTCDMSGNVPIDVQVSDVGGSMDGFSIAVDGIQSGSYNYGTNGTTTITILVAGDGSSHTIQVTDITDPSCNASTVVTTIDCTEPCLISNFEISTGTPTTHIVNVEDFVFDPAHITITSGDIVQWNWTGVIAHTSTSDAISGADSWESGLLDNGATYQSPILSDGVHPYYCIPHGGPGGVGMSGSITVLPNCTNGEVSATLTFNASGGSLNGYNIFIDGVITASSPHAYDPSGLNSIVVNIVGDGQSHTVQIIDANDSNCSITESIVTSDCEGCENFQAEFDYMNNGLQVSFTDQSTSGANEWLWGFGNGDISSDQNPIYTYDKDSSYVVCLLVQNTDRGCISNQCEMIEVMNITEVTDVSDHRLEVFPTLLKAHNKNNITVNNIPIGGSHQLAFAKIYMSSGQLVSNLSIPLHETIRVPFDYMQSGTYILNLVIGNKIFTVKLLSI